MLSPWKAMASPSGLCTPLDIHGRANNVSEDRGSVQSSYAASLQLPSQSQPMQVRRKRRRCATTLQCSASHSCLISISFKHAPCCGA
jgi:hypothetical protein